MAATNTTAFADAIAPYGPYLGIAAAASFTAMAVGGQLYNVIFSKESESEGDRRRRAQAGTPAGGSTSKFKVFSSFAEMLARPVMTCAIMVGVVYKPHYFQSCGFFPALVANYARTSITKALPSIYVNTMSEAYAYGSLAQRALAAMGSSAVSALAVGNATTRQIATPEAVAQFLTEWARNSSNISMATRDYIHSLLAEAGNVSGGRTVSLQDLLQVYNLILAQENQQSVTSKILGVFSLVNIMYFVSVLGMVAFFGPALYQFTLTVMPFLKDVLVWIAETAVRVGKFLVFDVAIPFYQHTRWLWETVFYYIAVYNLVESSRYADVGDRHSMGGVMSAFTALIAFGCSWYYSCLIRSTTPPPRAVANLMQSISFAFGIVVAGSGAILNQSSLMGYVTVIHFLALNGFYAVSYPLCTVVGFKDESSLIRTAQSCLTLVLSYTLGRAFGIGQSPTEQYLTKPFESAVSVLGVSGYMLALDIATGIYYNRPAAHALFIISAVGLTAAGSILGMAGLVNTSLVFGGLYGATFYGMVMRPNQAGPFMLWLFGGFASMYAASRFLSDHPDLLVAAITGGLQS